MKMCDVRIIRIDGTEESYHPSKPTLGKSVRALIGAECCDTVLLSKTESGMPDLVMMVDDTGRIDGKAINKKATALYHEKCGGVNINSIHGDVAIVHDGDFAK